MYFSFVYSSYIGLEWNRFGLSKVSSRMSISMIACNEVID